LEQPRWSGQLLPPERLQPQEQLVRPEQSQLEHFEPSEQQSEQSQLPEQLVQPERSQLEQFEPSEQQQSEQLAPAA
jgi:hypothetical protein